MPDDTGERSDRPEGDAATADGDASQYVGAYDKLVRDDIPAVVRDDGNRPVTRRVDGDERLRYLAAKLVEEATEYRDAVADAADGQSDAEADDRDDGPEAHDREEVLDELADVHAVLDAILNASDVTIDEVEARVREKADARGGFEDGVVLERIEARDEDGE